MNNIQLSVDNAINNSFSWHRVGMVASYWWSRLKMQVITYLLYSILSSAIIIVTMKTTGTTSTAFLASLTTFMAILAPIVFGMRQGREMSQTIPATNAEKLTFMVLYSLVFIPLITIVITDIPVKLLCGDVEINYMKQHVGFEISQSSMLLMTVASMGQIIAISTLVLLISTTTRQHSVILSVLWGLGLSVVPNFIIGIISGIMGFMDACNGMPMNETIMAQKIFGMVQKLMLIEGIIATAVIPVMIWILVKRFPKVQV